MDTAERDLLPPIESLTIFNLDGNELQMFMNGTWRNVPLYMGERHDGDIMTWREVNGHWVPSSDVNVIGQLTGSKVFILKNSQNAVEVRQTFRSQTKTGTGTGDILLFGDHSHASDIDYRITIDTAGDHNTATFKYSIDGGATFVTELIPVSDNSRTHLQNNAFVLFTQGTYVLGDYWGWVAIATGSQTIALKVNTSDSIVQTAQKVQVGSDSNQYVKATASTNLEIAWAANRWMDFVGDDVFLSIDGIRTNILRHNYGKSIALAAGACLQ